MDWTVSEQETGIRLDKFLAGDGRLGSRKRASVALARGKVFLNGAEAAGGAGATKLARGDRVRVWMDRPGSARRKTASRTGDLHILYEDESMIVLDKPAGLLAVPLERREGADSVVDQLVTYLRPQGKRKPLVVHRIDRDTSGLVVFAKTTAAQHALREQFKRHAVERVYRAVVYGHPRPAAGTWRDRLVWDHRALIQKETHPRDPKGKDAVCRYETLEEFASTSLIEVRLETGKRNQIRLQARLRGHTLVGERRYVFGPDELRPIDFPRQALHALRLVFAHPVNGAPMRFEAPVPKDFQSLVARLRLSA
ncbi:MAG TPA: RluA family pseudouridine synthase [Vicinamibacterales bacterium]|nr:RluA family pseudouridine synthase [Vicinamibacterales bacterium]